MIERRVLDQPPFDEDGWRVWTWIDSYTRQEVHRVAMRSVSPEIASQMPELRPSRLKQLKKKLQIIATEMFNLDC